MSAESLASLAAVAPVESSEARAPDRNGVGLAGAERVGRALGRVVENVRGAGQRWRSGLASDDLVAAVSGIVRPDAEERHWQGCFRSEPYHVVGCTYDDYAPAYRLGYSRFHGGGLRIDDVLSDAELEWPHVKGRSSLDWAQARPAFEAAWRRQDAQGNTAAPLVDVE
jgi:hypothetical protein